MTATEMRGPQRRARRTRASFAGGLAGAVLALAGTAGASDLVINEIHYNPPDAFDDAGLDVEFLELYNAGTGPIALDGMSFTGFDLVFPPGTSLGAGEHAIVAPSIADAQATWGVTPIAEFAGGGLSGKGELIELIAADGETVLDAVDYDDDAPWPGTPDGEGPSLELLNPAFDNALAASWAASADATPTPAAINSTFVENEPTAIVSVSATPARPPEGEAFEVRATLSGPPPATAPELFYRVGFDDEIGPVAMVALGDGVWSASLPAQLGGALVRYRVAAGDARSPGADDSIDWFGTVVQDPDVAGSALPVLSFYMTDEDYSGLYDTPYDDDEFPAVVAYGEQVFDNARIRIRGQSTRRFLKKSLKVTLPAGYRLDLGELGRYPVDEFALQADRGDVPFSQTYIAWETLFAEGEPEIANFQLRLERDGDFYGLYRLQEVYDGRFRSENGLDDGEFFKAKNGGWQRPGDLNRPRRRPARASS